METIIAVISIIIAIASVVFSIFTYYQNVIHDRKQATLEAYNRLQSEVFDMLNIYTPTEIRNICEDTKSNEYKILSGYLARIEHFCVGINEKIYDKNIFYTMAHGYFDGFLLKNRIDPLLESKNSGKTGTEIYYLNIYAVMHWMEKKSKYEWRVKNEQF